eukprot:15195976-Heterocapsa_arctica.AAC.1
MAEHDGNHAKVYKPIRMHNIYLPTHTSMCTTYINIYKYRPAPERAQISLRITQQCLRARALFRVLSESVASRRAAEWLSESLRAFALDLARTVGSAQNHATASLHTKKVGFGGFDPN